MREMRAKYRVPGTWVRFTGPRGHTGVSSNSYLMSPLDSKMFPFLCFHSYLVSRLGDQYNYKPSLNARPLQENLDEKPPNTENAGINHIYAYLSDAVKFILTTLFGDIIFSCGRPSVHNGEGAALERSKKDDNEQG